jgi:SAM-dependent methyltransferase
MEERTAYSDAILEHYRREAEVCGTAPTSTMRDEIVRERELDAILRVLDRLGPPRRVLEVGCGNGLLLEALRKRFPGAELTGLEFSPEMAELARRRGVDRCEVVPGDVKAIPFADGAFDATVSERCLINLLDPIDQERALGEIARVLGGGGHYVCVEAFTDALQNLNRAREELGLDPLPQPDHNCWLDKDRFRETIRGRFVELSADALGDGSLPPPNFLSSHYFVSRVLYPTEFVRFFAFLPPRGNYAPVQIHVLRRA